MIEGRHQILNECVELATRHLHSGVRFLHGAAGVLARSPGGLADLIDQHLPQSDQICLGELLVDPTILGHAIPEILDHCGD